MLENIFSHSVGCFFILMIVSFALQKLFSLMESYWFSFAFVAFPFGVKSQNNYQDPCLCFLLGVLWFQVLRSSL